MRAIALEEHYAFAAFLDGPARRLKEQAERHPAFSELIARLCDLGDRRIGEMDTAGVDVQALSLTAPGVEQLDTAEAVAFARQSNDVLAAAVRKHPDRFMGFATLALADPEAALGELERTLVGFGFKGVIINGHTKGRYLDDMAFAPVLERIEALGVPIYLHPTPSPKPVVEAWFGGFDPIVTEMLAGPGWGWHIETALHVLRMIIGGVFDRFPHLQVVIGHLGESLPSMMARVDVMSRAPTGLKKPVSAYLRENVHYTFAGFNFTSTFLDLLMQVGAERIMFSTDYPYASMSEARAFLDRLPVSPADREKIGHGNAERLFRM